MIRTDDKQVNVSATGEKFFPSSLQTRIGKSAAAVIELNDMYRVRKAISRKTMTIARVALGARARNAPRAVATPFPPRNLSQRGNMCPRIANVAATAARTSTIGGSGVHACSGKLGALESIQSMTSGRLISIAAATAANPFKASSSRVAIPNAGDVRATLVAPMLPLPVARTSVPRKNRTSRYPKGIDPSRYPSSALARMDGKPYSSPRLKPKRASLV